MLSDRDRIFTNLYGFHSPGLEAARKRGAWDGTKFLLEKGPRLDHRRDEEVGPARARRGGLPDRAQVVVHAEAVGRAAALPRRQRRRIRARHGQGPGDHAARPASPDRGLPPRLLRHGRARLLRLHPRRVREGARGLGAGRRGGLRGQPDRPGQPPRLPLRPLRPPRGRRLHLRRGDGAARKPRRQEGDAAAEAAVPGQHGPLRLPDHGEQRRVDRRRRHHPAARRRLVRRRSASRTTPGPSSSPSPGT